jgi:hypothetical protein
MSLPQLTAFVDEVSKLAGLASHPAIAGGATKKLLSATTAPAVSGLKQISKATSPAALTPPPNIFA